MDADVQKQNLEEMAAALGGHEITDDEGKAREDDTSLEDTASQEETPEEDSEEPTEVSKPAEREEEDEEEVDAVDESGKRYIPEKRFNKVYGKSKELERQLAAKEAELEALRKGSAPKQTVSASESATKADRLELEILKEKYPQFDQNSEEHSEVLDEMGYEIFVSNPGITRLEAARRALARAKKLGIAEKTIKTEARVVKKQQSDSGIASRVLNRKGTQPDPSSMSLKEKEEYLKANGMWD